MTNDTHASLSRGLTTLELLAAERRPLGLAEIARRIGLSKPGAHGLLSTLVRHGYVEHASGGIYRLGIKAWEIGRSVPSMALVQAAAPVMERLVARLEEGAILGVLSGFEVVYVHLVGSAQAVRVHAEIGDRIPAHGTSTGLALLATQPQEYLARYYPPQLPSFTPSTLVDPVLLSREIERVRRRGYAVNLGGWRSDVGGVAVAIPGAGELGPAGLCVAAPRYRMTRGWIEQAIPALREAAAEIGRALAAAGAVPAREAG